MVTCQSANQLKTPAKVSWAFKMVSQFGSLGYTIMGKTADLTVVQKTIIDNLHKEGVKVDVFQTCNRTHSDCLPVVDSPQCWGMVSCKWWCLSYLSTLKQNHWKRFGSLAYRNNSSLIFWSPFPVCIWPVYSRLYPLFCKHLLWPDRAVGVLHWTMVCRCCRLNESW